MEKEFKASILLILILGLGLVYVGVQVHSLQNRVDELDWLVIDSEVAIDNGTDTTTETVHLTRGATALEALRRTANVKTKFYSGMGEYITEINGVHENKSSGEYWMVYRWKDNKWKQLDVGANSYKLKSGDNIKFKYEQVSW